MLFIVKNICLNAVNGESILLELGREGVSLAESIPEGKIIEVHPGAGSGNNNVRIFSSRTR